MKKNSFRISLAVSLLVLASLACQAADGGSPAPTQTAVQPPQATEPTATPKPTTPPEPTQPVPQQPEIPSQGAGIACVGTKDQGVACLDESGWKIYNKKNSQLANDFISAVAACPDGRIAFGHFNGISLFDGKEWANYSKGDFSSISALACGEGGVLWVAHFEGVSRYDGQWTKFGTDQLASGDAVSKLVYDIGIGPDGTVWASTPNSVASFDGSAWTIFQEGQGFDKKFFFKSLAFPLHIGTSDNPGRVLVSHGNGIAIFEDGKWTISNSPSSISSVEDMVVDTRGRAWLGTLINGVYSIDGGSWNNQTFENSDLGSNDINALAADTGGRVWAATEYGLSVFTDGAWTVFRMDNSDLPVNDIRGVAVIADGPTLPKAIEKASGSLSGQVKNNDGSPVADSTVEICVQILGTRFFGATPCSDQPFFLTGKTDAEGKFNFENIPTGYYTIVMKVGDGWAQLTGNIGSISEQVLVEPGETTDVGDITMKE
jgi:hypothetical protein